MRGFALFIAGAFVGIAAASNAQSQRPANGVVALNHVAIVVPDVDKAVEYYTRVMGFPEAFRFNTASGQYAMLQFSQNTFLEIQPATPERPVGINHFGIEVENLNSTLAALKTRGATATPVTYGGTKSYNASVVDPNGIRTEIQEFPPESFQKQAMERWK
jgi:catechol 2,3-dioxygenase-like lactoylglutathione lyase family enzyme